jgi:hypothetical protein
VQPYDELEVLTDGRRRIAACRHDGLATEDPERPRDQEQRLEPAPTCAAGEERPGVLQDLDTLQPAAREPHVHHLPVAYDGAVERPHGPANSDQVLVRHEQPRRTHQGFGVQQRIGVDSADERIARQVEADVEGVGFAAAGLVHEE